MEKRVPESKSPPRRELKGVVKKIAGRLTSDPNLEEEGRTEMLGGKQAEKKARERDLDPDPYRRS